MDLQSLTRAIDEISLPTPSITLHRGNRATLFAIDHAKECYRQLEQQTTRLICFQQELKAYYRTLEQSLAPIESLPHELLQIVFENVVHSSMFSADAARTLSRVSSRWRTVAIGTPSLWTTMAFKLPSPPTSLALVETCLHRAGNLPLDIILSRTPNYPSLEYRLFNDLKRILTVEQVKDRICSLNISKRTLETEFGEWDFPTHFPSLEVLMIDCGETTPSDETQDWLLRLCAPQLRKFEASGVGWAGFSEVMHGMTHFALYDSYIAISAFASLLNHPWITHLRIENVNSWEDWSTIPHDFVYFSALQTLALEGRYLPFNFVHKFITIVHPEALKRISLELPDQSITVINDLIRFFQRTPSIEHVRLRGEAYAIAELLSLRTITSVDPNFPVYNPPSPPHRQPPFLPALKSLQVELRDEPLDDVERISSALEIFLSSPITPKPEATSPLRVLECLTTDEVIINALPLYIVEERCLKVVSLREDRSGDEGN